ncbi:MAG TPA: hypothetical protein VNQ55_05740 [Parapedobacter sp.]|nr:hypothetical protein [Parapedobacter sp.]
MKVATSSQAIADDALPHRHRTNGGGTQRLVIRQCCLPGPNR